MALFYNNPSKNEYLSANPVICFSLPHMSYGSHVFVTCPLIWLGFAIKHDNHGLSKLNIVNEHWGDDDDTWGCVDRSCCECPLRTVDDSK